MILAASALVLTLLHQIEEASHAEPPVFQIRTLLGTARLLPASAYAQQRRELVESALRVNAAIRDEHSRLVFQTEAAHLLAAQDAAEARRLCREIGGRDAVPCWRIVDPLEGLRSIAYLQKHTEEEARFLLAASKVLAGEDAVGARGMLDKVEAPIEKKAPPKAKPKPVSDSIKRKMDRADVDEVSDVERSLLFREVLDESDSIEDFTERLMHQGAIAVWFAANREEATASLTAAKLHKTFAEACRCEDAQCDSIVGRAECSENIDFFVQFLAEQKVDPAALRIRHPSLAARALVFQLKQHFQ